MKNFISKSIFLCICILMLPFLLTLFYMNRKSSAFDLDSLDFNIYYEQDGTKATIPFDEYLLGVVAANMPAGYNMEALKSQAIVSRTYALYNILLLQEDEPMKKDFSTSELGLLYISLKDMEQYWGASDYLTYFTKLENAVYGTKDIVITYNKDLILPLFFETGSGFTRNAVEALNVDVPYLISVSSRQDITSTNYLKISEYSIETMQSILSAYYENISISEDLTSWILVAKRDSIGYVTELKLGEQTISGEEFAKVMNLSSNNFYIEYFEGKIRIVCTGVGHGIGLSQYGANAMAQEGASYEDILTHYYTNVSLKNLSSKK